MGGKEIYIWDFPSLQLQLKTGESPGEAELTEWYARYGRLYDEDYEGRREGRMQSMVIDPHRQKIYLGRASGAKYHWDIVSQQWMEPGLKCSEVAMSRNAEILIGTHVGLVDIWPLATDEPMSRLNWDIYGKTEDPENFSQTEYRHLSIRSLVVGHDGQFVYFGYRQGDIEVFRIDPFESVGLWQGHQGYIRALALSPDGKVLASGDQFGVIKLWDLATQRALKTLNGHTDWIESLTFSPDGKLLASSSADRTIKLWGMPGSLG